MPLWIEIIILVIVVLIHSFISYRLGYKSGARYVLTEWKKVNSEFEEE